MPKPPVKSVLVRLRAYPKELAAWKRLARADASTLSTWIRDSLNMRLDDSAARSVPRRDGMASSSDPVIAAQHRSTVVARKGDTT